MARRLRQPRPKLQRAPATIAATALALDWQEDIRVRPDGARHARPLWLVEVRLAGGDGRAGGRALPDVPPTLGGGGRLQHGSFS